MFGELAGQSVLHRSRTALDAILAIVEVGSASVLILRSRQTPSAAGTRSF
jgi:hypothetical protein